MLLRTPLKNQTLSFCFFPFLKKYYIFKQEFLSRDFFLALLLNQKKNLSRSGSGCLAIQAVKRSALLGASSPTSHNRLGILLNSRGTVVGRPVSFEFFSSLNIYIIYRKVSFIYKFLKVNIH